MPLKAELDSLDGVDEGLQSHYTKHEDGRFRLDVEGMPDVSGLKSALEKERRDRKALKDSLTKFDGVDLEEIERLKGIAAKFESGDIDKATLDAAVEKRIKSVNEAHANALAEKDELINTTNGHLSKVLIDNGIASEFANAKGMPSALVDVQNRLRSSFTVKDGKVVALDKEGNTRYGSDGITPYGIKDAINALREDENAVHLWQPSKGSGAGGDGGGAGGTVRYKEDLGSPKAKSDYIGKHGQEKYLNLPNKPAQQSA